MSGLYTGPVQKIFVGLFRGEIYKWWISRSKARSLEAKHDEELNKALLAERIESAHSLKSDKGLESGHVTLTQRLTERVSSLRLERQARAELDDEDFLRALTPLHRGKLLDLRKKHHESSGLRRYMYFQLVKEKQDSLKKKLERPIAIPMWNTHLGYVLSLLYVAFMRCVCEGGCPESSGLLIVMTCMYICICAASTSYCLA
jgi:hypothetical protein